jgi:uncharacterized protein with HEPN domain
LDDNIILVRALSYSIGIIGEAASRVSQEYRDATPNIPWQQIIGMRNFLIHDYAGVDLDILWNTATKSIPSLIAELESILPPKSDMNN